MVVDRELLKQRESSDSNFAKVEGEKGRTSGTAVKWGPLAKKGILIEYNKKTRVARERVAGSLFSIFFTIRKNFCFVFVNKFKQNLVNDKEEIIFLPNESIVSNEEQVL